MFQLELRFPIPISHGVPNNASPPEGLKILFVALMVISSPWFIQLWAETHWWNLLLAKLDALISAKVRRTGHWKIPSPSNMERISQPAMNYWLIHPSFRGNRIGWTNPSSSISQETRPMVLIMTINSLTRPNDGIDNDSEWHQLIELMKINAWAKDIESFQMPKKPVEKTQPSSRLYPEVRIRHSVISFYT